VKYIDKGAFIEGPYRWKLWRRWNETGPWVVFIMLNPSTADGNDDDPTIISCVGIADALGAGGIIVVNMYAWRATDREELGKVPDPVGYKNDVNIGDAVQYAKETGGQVICAWGASDYAAERAPYVKNLLKTVFHVPLVCLKRTKSGAPGHPLFLKRTLRPFPLET
jgi:hypothetical protein